jgi:uncharacterized SAM-binding protein YcdF (DUF218 family)
METRKMNVKRNPLLILVGGALTLSGIYMLFTINFNLGQGMILGTGIFLLLWGLRTQAFTAFFRQNFFGRLCLGIILLFLTLGGAIALGVTVFGLHDTADFREDAVIVLGAGIRGETVTRVLAARLDRCLDYHRLNPSALIVVSGGRGPQESITEALAMKRYLIAKDIPEALICLEEQAVSTRENFMYAKAILDAVFSETPYRIAYITNDFHAYRASLAASAAGLTAARYSAGTSWGSIPANYMRETLAVLKTWLLGP